MNEFKTNLRISKIFSENTLYWHNFPEFLVKISHTATMPWTVRAPRLRKMSAQMRARPRLFDFAALFSPEIEVSSPNLQIICCSHAQILLYTYQQVPKDLQIWKPKDPQNLEPKDPQKQETKRFPKTG